MWNGIFKSYRVVEIIPVYQMEKDDWDLLDWGLLRNVAKNRIAEKADGDFFGFVKVNIFNKGAAKLNYLWPIDVGMYERIDKTGEFPEFINEPDVDDLTEKGEALDKGVDALEGLILFYGIKALIKFLHQEAGAQDELEPSPEGEQEPEDPEAEELSEEFMALLEEINAARKNGWEDFRALQQALLIALELVKHKGYAYLADFIKRAEEALDRASDSVLE